MSESAAHSPATRTPPLAHRLGRLAASQASGSARNGRTATM